MRRLRIAHLSDTHLGFRQFNRIDPESQRNARSVDFERSFTAAIDDILTRDVDLVLHGGDVFHHTRPSWSAVSVFYREMARVTAAGIPALVIAGNHDTPRLRTTDTFFKMLKEALPEVIFVTDYDQRTVTYTDLGLAVTAIPHGKLVDPIPPMALPTPGIRNVMLSHGMVSGMKMHGRQSEPGEEQIAEALLLEEFEYIGLGHFHEFQRVRHNVWYSGSTERTGWGDEKVEPGYVLVELGDPGSPPEVTPVPVPSRPMLTLPPIAGQGMTGRDLADAIQKSLRRHASPEAMTRVLVTDSDRAARREADLIMRHELGDLAWVFKIVTPADALAAGRETVRTSTTLDLMTLFQEFINGQGFEEPFRQRFYERGKLALDQAQERLDLEAATEEAEA